MQKSIIIEVEWKLQETTKLDTITNEGLTWINIEKPTRDTMENLLANRGFHFHELDIDDCLSKIQIPKIDKHNEYIFVVLHFPSSPIHAAKTLRKRKQERLLQRPHTLASYRYLQDGIF